jgi:hypothetical protein
MTSFGRQIRAGMMTSSSAKSRITAQRLHEILGQWRELTAPTLSSDDAVALIDAPRSSVFDAIGRSADRNGGPPNSSDTHRGIEFRDR